MNETSGSSAGKPASETQKSADEKVSEKQKVLYAKRHKVFYIRYFKIILYHTNTSYNPFSRTSRILIIQIISIPRWLKYLELQAA